MKAYISSHSKEQADNLKRWLESVGVEIVSTWHDSAMLRSAELTEAERQEKSARNLSQIDLADVLVLIACSDKVPGGKFVEAGYALGKGKRVVIHGRRENMMLWNATVKATDHMGELADLIRES